MKFGDSIVNQTDILLKREQFAVNLRKAKKQELLQKKRQKIATFDEQCDDSIQHHNYQQYERFRNDPNLQFNILNSVAPHWNEQLCVTD